MHAYRPLLSRVFSVSQAEFALTSQKPGRGSTRIDLSSFVSTSLTCSLDVFGPIYINDLTARSKLSRDLGLAQLFYLGLDVLSATSIPRIQLGAASTTVTLRTPLVTFTRRICSGELSTCFPLAILGLIASVIVHDCCTFGFGELNVPVDVIHAVEQFLSASDRHTLFAESTVGFGTSFGAYLSEDGTMASLTTRRKHVRTIHVDMLSRIRARMPRMGRIDSSGFCFPPSTSTKPLRR
jgi:hypothetical protein